MDDKKEEGDLIVMDSFHADEVLAYYTSEVPHVAAQTNTLYNRIGLKSRRSIGGRAWIQNAANQTTAACML